MKTTTPVSTLFQNVNATSCMLSFKSSVTHVLLSDKREPEVKISRNDKQSPFSTQPVFDHHRHSSSSSSSSSAAAAAWLYATIISHVIKRRSIRFIRNIASEWRLTDQKPH